MSSERNKQIALEFFDALNRGDGEHILKAYAPDGICWTAGSMPFSGTHTVAELGPIMADILGGFPDGLRFTIHGVTAEGDRVALEVESLGHHKSGKTYNNHYHFLMIFNDEGKIQEFKEYMDTALATEVLVQSS